MQLQRYPSRNSSFWHHYTSLKTLSQVYCPVLSYTSVLWTTKFQTWDTLGYVGTLELVGNPSVLLLVPWSTTVSGISSTEAMELSLSFPGSSSAGQLVFCSSFWSLSFRAFRAFCLMKLEWCHNVRKKKRLRRECKHVLGRVHKLLCKCQKQKHP